METKYKVIYDCNTGGFIDGFDVGSLEEGIGAAIDIYQGWMEAMYADNVSDEMWNDAINQDVVYVVSFDEETQEWNDAEYAVYLSDEQLQEIGWVER